MKKIIIISATKNSNFTLSEKINLFFESKNMYNSNVVSLEDYNLPLYTPTLEEIFQKSNGFPDEIEIIKELLLDSDAMVWCSPEYNGGISPIVTNSIAWISRATTNWKDAFLEKKTLVCTSSGGNGKNFIDGFKMQLKYLGADVIDDSFVQTKKTGFDYNLLEHTLNIFHESVTN